MLQSLQRIAQTLAFKIFLGLLVLSFIFLWGVGDLWQQFMNPANETLVSVGRDKIKMQTFVTRMQRQMEMVQRMSGNKRLTPEDFRRMGLEVRVLQELIMNSLIDQECERLGLSVPAEAVVRVIHRDPTFRGENGTFDRSRLARMLQVLRMSENEYIDMLQGEMRRQQFMSVMFVGMKASPILVDMFLKRFHQNLTLSILEIPLLPIAKTAGQANAVPAPTEEAFSAFYATNKAYYAQPERRSFKLLYLRYDDLPNKVTDAQVKEAFDSRFGKNVKVKFEQVKAELKAQLLREANAKEMEELKSFVDDKVAGGASLDDAAKQANQKFAGRIAAPGLVAHTLSLVSQDGRMGADGKATVMTELQSKVGAHARDHQDIVRLAFATEKDRDSETLQLPSGNFVIVHVTDVKESRIPEYSEIKDKIQDVVTRDAQFKATYEKAKVHVDKILAEKDPKKRPALVAFMNGKLRTVSGRRYELASQTKKYNISGFENRADDVNQGDLVVLPNIQKNTVQIIQVQKVGAPDVSAVKPEIRKQLDAGLTKEVREELQQSYIMNLQKRYKVDYNKKALKKIGLGTGK